MIINTDTELSYGQYMEIRFGLVWVGLVWFGFEWYGMVDGYYLDVIPCKIWKSYFEKQLSYGQYMEIWFGFEWYGTWVMFRCSYM